MVEWEGIITVRECLVKLVESYSPAALKGL